MPAHALLSAAREILARQAPGGAAPGAAPGAPPAGPPAGLPPGPLPTPSQIQGPIFVGLLINYLLLGTLILQVHRYTLHFYKSDTIFVKSIVYIVLVLDVAFSIIVTQGAWEVIIAGWGQLSLNQPATAALVVPSGGIIGFFVQIFFAWRIWRFNRKSWLVKGASALVVVLAFFQVSGALTFGISWKIKYNVSILNLQAPDLETPLYLWLVGSFANDILIALCMVLMLAQTRRQSKAIPSTVQKLNWLIIMAIETGIVTTIVAMLELILYVHPAFDGLAYHTAPAVCLGKFYSNMLMANLNGRTRIQQKSQGSIPMVDLQAASYQQRSGIRVTTTTQEDGNIMRSGALSNEKDRPFLKM